MNVRAVFIAFFFSLLCGRAGAHFTGLRLLGEDARTFTQATKPGEARGFKDERLGLTEETQSKVLWAGWLPVMEERTRTVSGVTGITGVTTRRWFQWGADLSGTLDGAGGIGGLVGIIEEDGAGVVTRTLLPVQDGLGNITAVIDQATGRTVARYDYGPFGEPLAESGEVDACPFRWQTKWYDAESQHYYFGYRHYDPRFGRWLSRDPLGEAGGFNLYAYCGNDPVNRHDPLGLSTKLNIDGSVDFFDDGWSSFGEMRDFLNTPLGKAQTILKKVDAEIRDLSNISNYATPPERQRSTDLIGLHYKIDRFVTFEQQRIQAAKCLGNTLAAEQEAARNTFGFSWLGTNGKVADLRAIGREIGAIQDKRFGDYFRDSLNSPLAYHKAAILGVEIGLTLPMGAENATMMGKGSRAEFVAANRVMVGGAYESRGGLLRMGAYDTKAGTIGLGKGGHFDGAAEAGMTGIRPETQRGLTMFQREGEVFWANDSLSLSKAVTQSEATTIQKALEAQFKGQTVKQVQQIGDVLK